MQQLPDVKHVAARDRCAASVLDVGLLVSRLVRAGMWQHRPAGLSVAQFRALTFVNAYPDASPSSLAEYLMLSRPAITRLLDDLVARRLVARRSAAHDRRRIALSLTAAGRRHLDAYFDAARALVAERLAPLSAAERATVAKAMTLMRPWFEAPAALDDARPARRAAP